LHQNRSCEQVIEGVVHRDTTSSTSTLMIGHVQATLWNTSARVKLIDLLMSMDPFFVMTAMGLLDDQDKMDH